MSPIDFSTTEEDKKALKKEELKKDYKRKKEEDEEDEKEDEEAKDDNDEFGTDKPDKTTNDTIKPATPTADTNLNVNVDISFNFDNLLKKLTERVMKYLSDNEDDQKDAVFGDFEYQKLDSKLTNQAVENVLKGDAVENELDKLLARETNPFRILGLYDIMTKAAFLNHHPSAGDLGIAKNKYYCDLVDTLNLYEPENFMNHSYYYTDLAVRKLSPSFSFSNLALQHT